LTVVRTVGALVRLTATLVLASLVVGMTAMLAAPQVASIATSGEWTHSPVSLSGTGTRSLIYDKNGELMATFFDQNRTTLDLAQIPAKVSQAVLAIEDADFYAHEGVNIKATGRALVENVDAGGISQGGSTITQQLIKNLVLTSEQTVERKIREAALAVRLEDQLSKDEILELYLNTVYFGSSAYGVQAAAEVYFGLDLANKEPDEVTRILDEGMGWPEAALLASLISNPTANDPTLHPQASAYQRGIVLDRMAELGLITDEDAAIFAQSPLPTKRNEPSLPSEDDFYVAEVRRLLLEDPSFLGGGPESRLQDLLGVNGGLRVYTAFDPKVQTMAENARDVVLRQRYKVDPMFTMSIASIDPETGAVRAMVGGESFDDESKFNIATQGTRQPGSSFKTFVLVAALRAGLQTNDIVNGQSPCEWEDPTVPGGVYEVENYGGSGGRTGPILAQLTASSNCAFLKIGLLAGLDNVIETAHLLGIKSDLKVVRSLPLGTMEVNPMEMANAYATIAAGGIRREPYFIERIERQVGDEWVPIYDRATDPSLAPERVISADIACWTTDALAANARYGTGARAGAAMGAQPAAGKTGTTTDWADAWFVGFTPYLATAVWMGYPYDRLPEHAMTNVAGVGRVTGGSLPAEAWGVFNAAYHADLPVRSFPTCPGFPRAGEYKPVDIDPQPQENPCPSGYVVDLNGDGKDLQCNPDLPSNYGECADIIDKYKFEMWDKKLKPIPTYCVDPDAPPPTPEPTATPVPPPTSPPAPAAGGGT
jgi:penicillin-binding protein 1A